MNKAQAVVLAGYTRDVRKQLQKTQMEFAPILGFSGDRELSNLENAHNLPSLSVFMTQIELDQRELWIPALREIARLGRISRQHAAALTQTFNAINLHENRILRTK